MQTYKLFVFISPILRWPNLKWTSLRARCPKSNWLVGKILELAHWINLRVQFHPPCCWLTYRLLFQYVFMKSIPRLRINVYGFELVSRILVPKVCILNYCLNKLDIFVFVYPQESFAFWFFASSVGLFRQSLNKLNQFLKRWWSLHHGLFIYNLYVYFYINKLFIC